MSCSSHIVHPRACRKPSTWVDQVEPCLLLGTSPACTLRERTWGHDICDTLSASVPFVKEKNDWAILVKAQEGRFYSKPWRLGQGCWMNLAVGQRDWAHLCRWQGKWDSQPRSSVWVREWTSTKGLTWPSKILAEGGHRDYMWPSS